MQKVTSMSGVARTVAGGALLMVLAMLGGHAAAADYPTRTVSIVVPFVAGSATDVLLESWPTGCATSSMLHSSSRPSRAAAWQLERDMSRVPRTMATPCSWRRRQA